MLEKYGLSSHYGTISIMDYGFSLWIVNIPSGDPNISMEQYGLSYVYSPIIWSK